MGQPVALDAATLDLLQQAIGEGRLFLIVLTPETPAATLALQTPRPLDPLDEAILRVVRAIVRRTQCPARTDSITVQVNCETQLELTEGMVRRRLLDLEARGHLYRLSPRTGWLVNLL